MVVLVLLEEEEEEEEEKDVFIGRSFNINASVVVELVIIPEELFGKTGAEIAELVVDRCLPPPFRISEYNLMHVSSSRPPFRAVL